MTNERLLKEKAKDAIEDDLFEHRDKLLKKFDKFIENENEKKLYTKRLDKIFRLLKDKFLFEGKHKKGIRSSDFYQRIELFMDYDEELEKVREKAWQEYKKDFFS